jgi:GrpB-like predicted nucleotidyltransferase (UPF0157 family)
MGRPTDYTEEIAKFIIEETANSTDSLQRIYERNKDIIPAPRTIRRWIAENEEFRHKYARAKEEQADVMAEEIQEIADQLAGKEGLTHEEVGAAKLRIDARKWAASHLKPKKYGNQVNVNLETNKIRVSMSDSGETQNVINL